MHAVYDAPFPRKLMGHGQGLYSEVAPNGELEYFPTADTLDVADALGLYWTVHPRRDELSLLLSGGFPDLASFGAMKRPPEGTNEAAFQADRLHSIWGVPRENMVTEGNARHTFEGFTIPIAL